MLFGSVSLVDGQIAQVDRREPVTLEVGDMEFGRKNGWMVVSLVGAVLGPAAGVLGGAERGMLSSWSLNQGMLEASSKVLSAPITQPESVVGMMEGDGFISAGVGSPL